MRCANCGAESSPESLSLCSVCGATLTRRWQQEVRCPTCGSYAAVERRVCSSCGASLNSKSSNWGVALLCLLAASAIGYSAIRYGLGKETLSALKRAPAAAIHRLTEWRHGLFQVKWERVAPTPMPKNAP